MPACVMPWRRVAVGGGVVVVQDATVAPGVHAGCFACTDDRPCSDFLFDNVRVSTGGAPAAAYSCRNVTGFAASGGSFPNPCTG
jgi:hypothetical protein